MSLFSKLRKQSISTGVIMDEHISVRPFCRDDLPHVLRMDEQCPCGRGRQCIESDLKDGKHIQYVSASNSDGTVNGFINVGVARKLATVEDLLLPDEDDENFSSVTHGLILCEFFESLIGRTDYLVRAHETEMKLQVFLRDNGFKCERVSGSLYEFRRRIDASKHPLEVAVFDIHDKLRRVIPMGSHKG